MAVRSRYDVREDRIVLTVGGPDGEHAFWVTRRLWLALAHELGAAGMPDDDDAAEATEPRAPRPIAREHAREAKLLQGIRIRTMQGGKSLVFITEAGSVAINIQPHGLAQIRRMLEVQADRAGWDLPAAHHRLSAQSLAGAALKRAGG